MTCEFFMQFDKEKNFDFTLTYDMTGSYLSLYLICYVNTSNDLVNISNTDTVNNI